MSSLKNKTNSLEGSLLPEQINEAQGTVPQMMPQRFLGQEASLASPSHMARLPDHHNSLQTQEFSHPGLRSLGKWQWLLHIRNGSVSHAFILLKKPYEILHSWAVLRFHLWNFICRKYYYWILSVCPQWIRIRYYECGWALGKARILLWANTSLKKCWIFAENWEVGDEIFVSIPTFSCSSRVANTSCMVAAQKGARWGPPSGFWSWQPYFHKTETIELFRELQC